METTLNLIRSHLPETYFGPREFNSYGVDLRSHGQDFWKNLLKNIGKVRADDDPLPIKTILALSGIDDAVWCLRAVTNSDREIRLFAIFCAEQVQYRVEQDKPFPKGYADKVNRARIEVFDIATRFANGHASKEELISARKHASSLRKYHMSYRSCENHTNLNGMVYITSDNAWEAAYDAFFNFYGRKRIWTKVEDALIRMCDDYESKKKICV